MDEIDKTIIELVNIINKTSIEELNNIKIEESSTGRINMKTENGNTIYVVPKEYFDKVSQAVENAKENRKLEKKKENRIFDEENVEIFGVLNKNSDQAKKAREIEKARKEKSNNYSSTNHKRNIKNNPKKMKRERLKANAKKCLKIILATLGIGAVLVAGGKCASNKVEDYKDYKEVEASVEDLTEEQIEEKAEETLIEKISEATSVAKEEISYSSEYINSSSYTTTVKAGEDKYVYSYDYRDGIDFNNGTLDGSVAKMIKEINTANGNRRQAINALKNVQKNDLKVVDGKKLSIDKDKQTDDEKDER